MQTQWRVGMGGATGLDYAGVRTELEVNHQLHGKKLRTVWQAIKACEQATLSVWAKRAKQQSKKDTQHPNQGR